MPNFKTINGESVQGEGDLEVTGSGAAWADITGTLADNTDLQAALDAKAASLGADDNYVTDAEKTKLSNLSGTNSGDNAANNLYSGLAASKQDALVSATNIKTVNGSTILGSGNLVVAGDLSYVPTTANTAVNVTLDATIVTRDVTGVAAGDQLVVEADFTIHNNSGTARVYVITIDFDGLFDIEFTTGSMAVSATLMHPFYIRAVLDVRASNLAYAQAVCEGELAAGRASGEDSTMAATHLRAMGWGTTASDATGTCTVALKVRSANATAAQTLRLHQFSIRKMTPT